MKEPEVIELSRNPVKLLIWGVILAFIGWLVVHAVTTVLLFSLAALMAYLISPAVEWFSTVKLPKTNRKIPWAIATGIVYLAALSILVVLLAVLVPLITQQFTALVSSSPEYLKKIESEFWSLQAWVNRLHISVPVQENIKKYGQGILEKVGATFSAIAASTAAGLLKLVSVLLITITAFFFSMFIVLEQKRIKHYLFEMFPHAWRDDTEELFRNVNRVVGVFIRGQLIMACIVATGSYVVLVALSLLGVHYSYSLITAVFTGLFYPIPFVGFWIPRLIPPVLAYAQTGEWFSALWVMVGLMAWGLVADNIILPFVVGKGIGISPLMVLLVVFAGGELFGIWGLILSIPAAAIIRLIFFYMQKHITI